jgi:hypothetical protein
MEEKKVLLEKTSKGKSDNLNNKISKASIKDMKEHLFIPAAFFEQFRDIYIHPEEGKEIYNLEKPNPVNDKDLAHYKQFTVISKEMREASQKGRDEIKKYGDQLTDKYLAYVRTCWFNF